jgi:replication factor C large subunit
MFPEKHAPSALKDVVGAKQQINDIRKWLTLWKKGSSLIIFGPTGVGKSLVVKLIAKECGYELIESHASDDRTQKNFSDLIKSTRQQGLTLRRKIFLIDEVDMLDSVKPITEIIKVSEFPVVLIASDPYSKKLYNIRKKSKLVKFDKVSTADMLKFLLYVCDKEKIVCDTADVSKLARTNNGDLRAALIDLESLERVPVDFLGQREQKGNIFELLKVIMKTKSIDNAKIAMKNSEDIEELILWIGENVCEEYDGEDLAAAYDYLSKADISHSRIMKRQAWSLQKYFFDLSVLGVAVCKRNPSGRFVMYKPPVFHYNSNKELLKKIGKKVHTSSKKAGVYVPIIKNELDDELSKKFDFDEDDVAALK